MKLNLASLQSPAWKENGYELPQFDIEKMRARTAAAPKWLHFGAGNIFRAFPAARAQQLLNDGNADTGIIVCEGFDGDIIDMAYAPFDNLSVLVVLKADGTIEKKVIASVADSLRIDGARPEDWARVKAIFAEPSLQMASFTITEYGYALTSANGATLPGITADMQNGPDSTTTLMGKVCALMLARYNAGELPMALVSMDNCSHNGAKLQSAVLAIAHAWQASGIVPEGFVAYLEDTAKVSFPWSMIDKITPRPDAKVAEMLRADGYEYADTIHTAKNTFTASFVNAEQAEYLVIEDAFPNGRPALDKAGIYFVDRDTVNNVERMKVCTCLNPLHTALAVLGCMLGKSTIAEEMRDSDLKALVERIGYVEGLPVVTDPGIIKPRAFIDEVLNVRLPNPFMPDTPQRIATDTSLKLSIRFGGTIGEYVKRDMSVSDLKGIAFVLAAWLRYLTGIDDEGKPFEISKDPQLAALQAQLAGLALGSTADCEVKLQPVLANASIFGVDLYSAGMADDVISIYKRLMAAPGAVRTELHKLVVG